jgi:hypothetical protein
VRVRSMPRLEEVSVLGESSARIHREGGNYRSATALASCGWDLPVSSLMEFVAMAGGVPVVTEDYRSCCRW